MLCKRQSLFQRRYSCDFVLFPVRSLRIQSAEGGWSSYDADKGFGWKSEPSQHFQSFRLNVTFKQEFNIKTFNIFKSKLCRSEF